MESILVIDDDLVVRSVIGQALERSDLQVYYASDESSALAIYEENRPMVVLLDIHLGKDNGLNTFLEIRKLDPRAIVIIITGNNTTEFAIESIKIGAFDYLVKPLDLRILENTIEQGLRICRTIRVPTTIYHSDSSVDDSDRIVGNSRAIQAICKSIGKAAPQNINVLILGESGTGKELVAKAIYQHSQRSQSIFLAINCAAIPELLLESELFGHEKGSFTGADRKRIGKFEQCDGGTLFLDEIGDMPLATQAKMLRLLQEGEFQRVGGNEVIKADVRLIAATNQDIEGMIEKGKFRRDLFYRIRGMTISIPPLRQRLDDVPELAHYFLFRFNRQLGTEVQSIAEPVLRRLQSYGWPGNIRELQSVLRESMIGATGPTLLEEFLPSDFEGLKNSDLPFESVMSFHQTSTWEVVGQRIDELFESGSKFLYRESLLEFDRLMIQRAMEVTQGNQLRAAELLGISRPTLRSKLRLLCGQRAQSP